MILTANNYALYYNGKSNNKVVSMISTVGDNQRNYTHVQYERENISIETYQMVGYPSIKDYKNIIKMNSINNFSVTIEYINKCDKILGPDIYTLKGRKFALNQKRW